MRANWVPVTTAWRVIRLRMEERPPIRRVPTNILKKMQSRTADKGGPPAFYSNALLSDGDSYEKRVVRRFRCVNVIQCT
jgi:hypothetical protein